MSVGYYTPPSPPVDTPFQQAVQRASEDDERIANRVRESDEYRDIRYHAADTFLGDDWESRFGNPNDADRIYAHVLAHLTDTQLCEAAHDFGASMCYERCNLYAELLEDIAGTRKDRWSE